MQQLHSSDWMVPCDAARLLGQSGIPKSVEMPGLPSDLIIKTLDDMA